MLITSLDDLRQLLTQQGIDLRLWGTGAAKTLEHLWQEIQQQETRLTVDQEQGLRRHIDCVGLRVFHTDRNQQRWLLREDKQVFKADERTRQRSLDVSLAEKMAPDETPPCAMIRALKEELGLTLNSIGAVTGDVLNKTRTSNSYPMLQSEYHIHLFDVELNNEQFQPDGYIERQVDKDTYFTWCAIKREDDPARILLNR